MPEGMYAAVLHELGTTPRYERFQMPRAADGEAVVAVTAAALKPSDRLMARGIGYAPATLPHVVGLDGVGRLEDGSRVVFMIPQSPFGGMAEQTLVRHGAWLPVPDPADDITAAAFANPGMAAWKTVVWEGEVEVGRSVLVLGATGASGRIAAQLAAAHGARVVVAGRNRRILGQLVERGSAAAIDLDAAPDRIAGEVADHGPFDLVVDYVWGLPAQAVFQAFAQGLPRPQGPSGRTRYIVVGMAAGEAASLPAMAVRRAPLELIGSGTAAPPTLAESAAAFADLLRRVGDGEIGLDIDTRPLAEVEQAWNEPDGGTRVVFVP